MSGMRRGRAKMGNEFRRVDVGLGERSYPIHIGSGVLPHAGALLAPYLKRPKVAVITETTVARHHLATLEAALEAEGIAYDVLELPPGEASKSWRFLQECVDWLLDMQIERDDLVLAFGGGVIGDLVGFAASVLRRGVRFAQIPTTLLAQVDSSVGGKTGINARHGKNLIGAFHQPVVVLADVDLLATLSPRDFLAGYGEVVKYAMLGDAGFFEWLEAHGPALRDGDLALRAEAVERCCAMKAAIVARDEHERGERALLNLGHTFGHALEAATGYSDRLLHGEGVAIGMMLAAQTSERHGFCASGVAERLGAHLEAMGMKAGLGAIPGALPPPEALIALMRQDKKTRAGQMHFIMLEGVGAAFSTAEIDLEVVASVLGSS